LVFLTAIALWLVSGVRLDEIVRFVGYELGFVLFPGLAVYRALVSPPGGRLRQVVLGWSLGYLLEILAFLLAALAGVRPAFYVYPLVVGGPAAVVAWRRPRQAHVARAPENVAWIWTGAALCALLLVYLAVIGFSQMPLPRDVQTVTYQEDTPYVIALAAEALHHWPMTLPMVSGHPLHYHLFAFLHMAAVTEVTGIDLSVVVMRLYEVPLFLLFALQLVLLGRRIGRTASVGVLAMFLVLFLGELDLATGTQTGRFLFYDFFFYWLFASHTFLFGFVFFIPAVFVVSELLTGTEGGALRRAQWLLASGFLVGCVGAKSYSIVPVAGALLLFLLWRSWLDARINRPALGALAITASVYVLANALILGFSAGGSFVKPLTTIERTGGVEELSSYFDRLWGTTHVPAALGVPYGVFGLLGVPLLGIGLLLVQRRFVLSPGETWLLALFVTAFAPLLLMYQFGFGQLFLVFYGVVPGTVLAAGGYRLFWLRYGRERWLPALLVGAVGVSLVLGLDQWLDASARVGILVGLFALVLAMLASAVSARYRVGVGVAAVALVLLETPLPRTLSDGAAAFAAVVAVATVLLVAAALLRRPSLGAAVPVACVGGILVFGVLNTPLDWFPHLARRALDGHTLYQQQYAGLTADLYDGLTWIRDNTPTNAVLVVNNHSIHPSGSDSKYFYYTAFAQRRVVLESWDYTEAAVKRHVFSIDRAHSPYPERLALSDAVFEDADRQAVATLARRYGATYLVADKVHGPASPLLPSIVGRVFSNPDVDVYEIGKPGAAVAQPVSCTRQQDAGIAVVFGHRSSQVGADALRRSLRFAGFPGVITQQRGCKDFAVVLTGFTTLAQAREFKREAARANFQVAFECRTTPAAGGLNAVFGHRRTERAAAKLEARAAALGFQGLDVQQDRCGDWEVDLAGLRTAAQRIEFREEAARVGFHVVYEPG
jgi:hypothetical protein